LSEDISLGFLSNKREKLQVLKTFISDNPQLVKSIEDDDFKMTPKNVRMIIRKYNYQYLNSSDRLNRFYDSSRVNFFVSNHKMIKDSCTLIINDSMKFKFKSEIYLKMNASRPAKICVSLNKYDNCNLISIRPFESNYFLIKLEKNGLSLVER
jgi:hypothetical protein